MENIRKEVAQTNDRGLQRSEHRTLVDSAQREVSSGYKPEPFRHDWASTAGGELPDAGIGPDTTSYTGPLPRREMSYKARVTRHPLRSNVMRVGRCNES